MKKKNSTLLAATLLFAFGFVMLTSATGCGSPVYSENESVRPWNEPRGFQYQNSRVDR